MLSCYYKIVTKLRNNRFQYNIEREVKSDGYVCDHFCQAVEKPEEL